MLTSNRLVERIDYISSPEIVRQTTYWAINPFFFDFLKHTRQEDEHVEVVAGLTIDWTHKQRLPIITIDQTAPSEDAQLFVQIYKDQLVEVSRL